jgi:surfeit locus 1 family protein
MTFRPYPGFTIFTVIMLAILCGLGVWQLERLQWKLALIARVSGHMAAAPLSLEQARALGADEVQYHRVTLRGIFNHAQENYVFTTDASGDPVYHVLTPLFVEESGAGSHWLMVDRGEVPKDRLDPASRRAANASGTATVTGVWRVPDPPGTFTPAPDRAHRIWYSRDLNGMARADGIALKVPALIEADATPNPGGWPKGGQTVVTFRNEHLSYAITWFGLAAGLLGVWIAYHVSRSRLSFK